MLSENAVSLISWFLEIQAVNARLRHRSTDFRFGSWVREKRTPEAQDEVMSHEVGFRRNNDSSTRLSRLSCCEIAVGVSVFTQARGKAEEIWRKAEAEV